mgnify:CR=1 FL=1
MIVKNNIEALRVINLLDQNNNMLQQNLNKVATGTKITTAQDDSAPWSISERMRMRIRALEQSNQNAENDSALMKTAEGAVANTIDILRVLKEKAINSANDSNTDEDRRTIQKEMDQFIDQIDDNALVQFNGKYLIDGSKNNAFISSKTKGVKLLFSHTKKFFSILCNTSLMSHLLFYYTLILEYTSPILSYHYTTFLPITK